MDDLKGKFKTLFSKASNAANKLSNQGFQGQGHRLGTAEVRVWVPQSKASLDHACMPQLLAQLLHEATGDEIS
jgi:hypothetical protein